MRLGQGHEVRRYRRSHCITLIGKSNKHCGGVDQGHCVGNRRSLGQRQTRAVLKIRTIDKP